MLEAKGIIWPNESLVQHEHHNSYLADDDTLGSSENKYSKKCMLCFANENNIKVDFEPYLITDIKSKKTNSSVTFFFP